MVSVFTQSRTWCRPLSPILDAKKTSTLLDIGVSARRCGPGVGTGPGVRETGLCGGTDESRQVTRPERKNPVRASW